MGLFAGQKWCISGNPGNTLSGHHLSVGNPSVCSQGMPCQVLWSGMLGLGRGGQRQLRLKKTGSGQPLRAKTDSTNNARWTIQQNLANQTYKGRPGCTQIFEWLNLVFIINIAQQNNCNPKQFSGWCLIVNRTFPCQKGVQNRTLTQDPRTFTKMSALLLQTPLVSCWHQRGAFGNPLFYRDLHPAHLGTSRH